MRRPIVLSAIISVLISIFSISFGYISIWILFLLLLVLMVYYIIAVKQTKYLFVFIIAILTVLNTLLTYAAKINPVKNLNDENFRINCTVLENDYNEYSLNYIVKVTSCTNKTLVGHKMLLYSGGEDFSIGDEINCDIVIEKFISQETKWRNFSENIFVRGSIYHAKTTGKVNWLYRGLAKLRSYIENILFQNVEYNEASTITTVLLGNRSYHSLQFENNVINSGVGHVMVVSGMHMTILCGGFFKFCKRIFLNKRLVSILSIIFTLFFMALCGFTPSVLRAGIMYFVLLISFISLRRRDALTSLSAAVVIIVLMNPFIVGSISFCLSAASTAGIIILNPVLVALFKIENVRSRVLKYLLNCLTVTLSALAFTLPISIVAFGGVSLVCILSNILISFAVTLMLSVSSVGIILRSQPVLLIGGWLSTYVNSVISYLGELPFSYVSLI